MGESEPWAPPAFIAAFKAARACAVACGATDLLLVGRHEPLKFYAGELQRLATYASAAAQIAAPKV